jgi:hypothetical protein
MQLYFSAASPQHKSPIANRQSPIANRQEKSTADRHRRRRRSGRQRPQQPIPIQENYDHENTHIKKLSKQLSKVVRAVHWQSTQRQTKPRKFLSAMPPDAHLVLERRKGLVFYLF